MRPIRLMARTLAGAACLSAVALAPSGAGAAPGDKQFVAIANHNPSGFLLALRAGADFVKSGRGHQFRIVLAGAGIIVAIPGTSTVQRQIVETRRGAAGLTVIACKEAVDALSRANKRRIPLIPGVQVTPCSSLRNQMTRAGWEPAPGLRL